MVHDDVKPENAVIVKSIRTIVVNIIYIQSL